MKIPKRYTKEFTEYAIGVMNAFLSGKTIEVRTNIHNQVNDRYNVAVSPEWRWDVRDYRIKPELLSWDYKYVKNITTNKAVWIRFVDNEDVIYKIIDFNK